MTRSIPRPVALSALLTLLCFPALAQPGGGPPPANVELDPIRLEVVELWREITGEVRSLRRSVLAAEQAGLLMEILVEEGDAVAQGTIIARLDDTVAAIEVAEAEADILAREGEIAERQTLLSQRERDLQRVRELVERASASGIELEDAQWGVELARARLAQSEGALKADQAILARAQDRQSKMVVRAPFDGTVVAKRSERGQWVERGGGIVELVSLKEIEAKIDVPEFVVKRLDEPTAVARINISALDLEIESRITQIIPDADRLSRLFPVRIVLSNLDGRIRPGMSVTALVPIGRSEEALTVHKDAILRDDAGEFIFFNAGGVAAVARVERLFATRDRVAIRAPSAGPGMGAVVKGNERLFPGQPLTVLNQVPGAGRPSGGAASSTGSPAGGPTQPPAASGGGR
jgi:RND family efflux transporter MFP subunit